MASSFQIKSRNFFKVTGVLGMMVFVSSCGTPSSIKVASPFEEVQSYNLSVLRKKKETGQQGMGELFTNTKVVFNSTGSEGGRVQGEWIYGKTVIEGANEQPLSPEEEEVINIYEGLSFKLKTNDSNKVELENFLEVRANLEALFFKVYGRDSVAEGSDMYQRIKGLFQVRANNSESLLENFFPEIPLFFSVINKDYKNNHIETTDSIESPYGGEFLKIVSSVEIEKDELGNVIIQTDSIPQEDLDFQLKEYVKATFGAQADQIPLDQFPQSKYQATTIIEVMNDEVLRSLENEKILSNGEREMVNTLTIIVEEN